MPQLNIEHNLSELQAVVQPPQNPDFDHSKPFWNFMWFVHSVKEVSATSCVHFVLLENAH